MLRPPGAKRRCARMVVVQQSCPCALASSRVGPLVGEGASHRTGLVDLTSGSSAHRDRPDSTRLDDGGTVASPYPSASLSCAGASDALKRSSNFAARSTSLRSVKYRLRKVALITG